MTNNLSTLAGAIGEARRADSTLRRHLAVVAQGKTAQLSRGASISIAALDGIAIQRGLARVVKHRDHTRTLVLTGAGRAALRGGKAVR